MSALVVVLTIEVMLAGACLCGALAAVGRDRRGRSRPARYRPACNHTVADFEVSDAGVRPTCKDCQRNRTAWWGRLVRTGSN